jgi:hypothetical protein
MKRASDVNGDPRTTLASLPRVHSYGYEILRQPGHGLFAQAGFPLR